MLINRQLNKFTWHDIRDYSLKQGIAEVSSNYDLT